MSASRTGGRVLLNVLSDRGMTAAELARKSGVSPTTISNAITGSHAPSIHTLRAIEDVLGTTVVTQALAMRSRCALAGCRRQFIKARPWQRFCRRACSQRASGGRRNERRRNRVGTELAAVRRDVDRMCSECVGASLVCVQGDCPLRRWSPYPLAVDRRSAA